MVCYAITVHVHGCGFDVKCLHAMAVTQHGHDQAPAGQDHSDMMREREGRGNYIMWVCLVASSRRSFNDIIKKEFTKNLSTKLKFLA